MTPKDELVAFTRPDADEIIRKVLGSNFVGLGQNRTTDDTSLVLAFTTGGATARSGTTLGYGTCSPRYLEYSGTTRTITTLPDTYDFYNVAATAIGPNKYIMILRLGSTWLCVWEECE